MNGLLQLFILCVYLHNNMIYVILLVKQNIEYGLKIMIGLFHWKSYPD